MMKHIFPIFILFLFLTSCESNPLEVDVSDINVELEFHRYDVDMFTSNDAEALGDVSADLYAKTGELYEFYTMEMLRVGSPKDDSIAIYLNYFVRDSMMWLVFDSVQTKFEDFKSFNLTISGSVWVFKILAPSHTPKEEAVLNSPHKCL